MPENACLNCDVVLDFSNGGRKTTCADCDTTYYLVETTLYAGDLPESDILGLIEIFSKTSSAVAPKNLRKGSEANLCAFARAYEERGGQEFAQLYKTDTRFREYAAFRTITAGVELDGKLGLDVGAGFGTDTLAFINAGARMVSLDFNPHSVRLGQEAVPEAKWLGGNASCLPFDDTKFDFVVANAALHHTSDFIKVIHEMLRVTKENGYVFLISDPFCEEVSVPVDHERIELSVYKRHPMVLQGVNEQMLPVNQYLDTIEPYREQVFTSRVFGHPELDFEPHIWEDVALDELRKRRGNISSRLVRPASFRQAKPKARRFARTSELFASINEPHRALSTLAQSLTVKPSSYFPFKQYTKFELLNGWLDEPGLLQTDWRRGYLKPRAFVSSAGPLRVFVRPKDRELELQLWLNGTLVEDLSKQSDEVFEFKIPAKSLGSKSNFLHFISKMNGFNSDARWHSFDERYIFDVMIESG